MEIVEILTMNQEIEHVVALTADLKTNLHPVKGCRLEELSGLEGTE